MRELSAYHTVSNKAIIRVMVLIIVITPLLGTVLAIILLWNRVVNWSDLALLAAMYSCTAFGVTIGYHRMLTHRSFQPHPIVKAIFLVLGTTSAQGPALEWAASHIKHHALADQEGDPHSPLDGFLHAHMGWFFNGMDDPNIYCRHLVKDPMVVFISRTFWLWVSLSLLVPFLIGGWTGLIWGGLVRMFLTQHVTFSVNSICHMFGKREFETKDQSRNEWIIGLLAFGDGWHNNHHAFPRSAFHGLHWWQFDFAGYIIWTLERLGLARNVYRIPPALLERYSSGKTRLVPDTTGSGNDEI